MVATHTDGTDTALLREVLAAQDAVPRFVRLPAGEPIPDLADLAGVVVLGGPMGAYQADRFPFLNDTMRLLDRAIEQDVPTLAVCLGAQLLALVAGGTAYPGGAGLEWGFVPIRLTDAGQGDPVLTGIEGEHFSFHSDSFDLPPGVDLLAESEDYPQAFRVGSALGLQFHPELSVAGMHRLIARVSNAPAEQQLARAVATARRSTTHATLAALLARWARPSISDATPHRWSRRSGWQQQDSPLSTDSGRPSSRRPQTG